MKYMKQFGIILGVTCAGEIIKYFVPLPVPGSIYGLLLMLIFLMSGIIILELVKETAEFLIEIMPLMFIPAGVGLLNSWGQLQRIVLPVSVITLVSTFVVMGVTGKVTDRCLEKRKGETEDGSGNC